MKRYAGRITVIIGLILFFITIYTVVSEAFGKSGIRFGYWVNLNTEDEYRNFVIVGTDKDEVRTDLILFCRYSEKQNTLNVIQIPRDTKVETSRSDKKINSAYGSGGISALKSEIESITGIYPDNYVVLNFKGFRELIDAIDGVEFNVPIRMYYTDPVQNLTIDLQPGKQTLDGKKAEMFMRFRKNNDGSGYAEGDIGRLKAQKSFYGAVIDKLLSFDGFLSLGEVMNSVGNNLKTDFTLSDLTDHIDDLKKLNAKSINVMMLPGRGEYIDGISYYVIDKDKTRELLNEYFNFTK